MRYIPGRSYRRGSRREVGAGIAEIAALDLVEHLLDVG
jgi:hypothetical protein